MEPSVPLLVQRPVQLPDRCLTPGRDFPEGYPVHDSGPVFDSPGPFLSRLMGRCLLQNLPLGHPPRHWNDFVLFRSIHGHRVVSPPLLMAIHSLGVFRGEPRPGRGLIHSRPVGQRLPDSALPPFLSSGLGGKGPVRGTLASSFLPLGEA